MLNVTSEGNAVLVPVKVVPGASRTRLVGEWDGRVKIAVAVPAEKGKANKALVAFLAALLGVRKNDVTVLAGHGSSIKTVKIERVTAERVRAALKATQSRSSFDY